MQSYAEEIKALSDLAEHVLMEWLESPPTERRERQALQLVADAGQNLYAACVNLGVYDGMDDH